MPPESVQKALRQEILGDLRVVENEAASMRDEALVFFRHRLASDEVEFLRKHVERQFDIAQEVGRVKERLSALGVRV